MNGHAALGEPSLPRLEHAELSDVGLRRSSNQDALAFVVASSPREWLRRGHLFLVADGMGAHAAGELASKMAADLIPHLYYKSPGESAVSAIENAVQEANARIFARGRETPEFRGMGTTGSVLALLPQGALVAHVGDSRVYRLRGSLIEQLSFDHSLVWEMEASGRLPDGEFASVVPRNIITRSLGPNEEVQVDIEGPFPLAVGDTFLLCSDGLSGQVEDDELGAVLSVLPPGEAAQALVDLANLRGGPDNITLLIIRIVGADPLDPAEAAGPRAADRNAASGYDRVHPVSWIALGVLGALTLALAVMGKSLAALAAGAATLIAGAFALVQFFSSEDRGAAPISTARHGSGPHRKASCQPSAELVEKLAKVVQQLRDAASEEHWQVRWAPFDALTHSAAQATAARNFGDALRDYCRAVSFMMRELRGQRAH